jgi:excisionase family DNA binding protein
LTNDTKQGEKTMKYAYSIKEVSEVTSIGRTSVYSYINRGLLKARKTGKRTIILKEDLDDFLQNLDQYETQQTVK